MTITYKQTAGKIVESTDVRSLEYKQGLAKGEEPKLRVNGAADIPISKIASISLEERGVVIPLNLNDFTGQLSLVEGAAAIRTDVPLAYALNYSWTKGSSEPIVTNGPILKFTEEGITLKVVITSDELNGSITETVVIPLPDITGTITLTGDVEVGSSLVASHDTLTNLVYQWYLVDAEEEWTPLEEDTDTLSLITEYENYYIGVRATHANYSGYLEAVTETVVTNG